MRTYDRTSSINSYEQYLIKREVKINEKVNELFSLIENSSLKKEDKLHFVAYIQDKMRSSRRRFTS
jgi:hypothetical protein